MREISNSLRQILGARPEPQEHPDPDVLTAYGEQLLPAAERREVVLHLAQCSFCREVISLSLPPALPKQATLPAALTRSSFWVPAFRWGAAAATLAIAVTLVVEKPWKQAPATQVSSAAKDAKPAPAVSFAVSPTATAPTTHGRLEPTEPRRANAGSGLRAVMIPEPHAQQQSAAASLQSAEVLRVVPNNPVVTSVAVPERREAVSPASPSPAPQQAGTPSQTAYTYAGRDWVNTNVLKNESVFTGNSLSAADAPNLPQAPAARNSNGQPSDAAAKTFPRIAPSEVNSRALALAVVPPNTAEAAPSSTPDVTTFKSSRNVFRIMNKAGKLEEVARGFEKAGSMGGPPSGLAGFSGYKRPSLKPGDNDTEENAQAVPLFRINNGILLKSTDYTKWHEAFSQSSDLQLKVLVTRGDHVWAGGNNATLVHSWNGGVQWETLKVPDSGDITAITIDDGWEVKTSNGQTFVSQDRGKTWVPLQQQPK